jgi:peptidyl-prolyl cis-trans isomerase B (cyclophilin B)
MNPSIRPRHAGRVLLCLWLTMLGVSTLAANPPVADVAMERIDRIIAGAHVDKTAPDWRLHLPRPDKVTFDPAHAYYVRMQTSLGSLLVELRPEIAPGHVASLLYLTKLGFYDGMRFSRVTSTQGMVGVDPNEPGVGPGYRLVYKSRPSNRHDRAGCLSMPIEGPGTDGKQLILTFGPAPWLDYDYALLGHVVEGLDTLKVLQGAASPGDAARAPLTIVRMTAEVRGEAPDRSPAETSPQRSR